MNFIIIIAVALGAYLLFIKHIMDNAPVIEDDIENLNKMLDEK